MSITKTSMAVLAVLAFATPALAQQSGGAGGNSGSGSSSSPKDCPAGAPNCVPDPGAPKPN